MQEHTKVRHAHKMDVWTSHDVHDETKVSEKEKGAIRRPAEPGLLRSKSRKGAKAAGFGAAPR